jgi:hypothetical protein
VALVAVVAAALLVPSSAFAVTGWSGAMSIDNPNPPTSVSCPSSSFCATVGTNGYGQTFNGGSWSSPLNIDPSDNPSGHPLTSVSCPSSSFCAAVDLPGNALTFNGSSWSPPVDIDSLGSLNSVSCASSSFCVAVDGDGYAFTYNGSFWSAPAPVNLGSNDEDIDAVSCPSSSFCVAAGESGYAETFNGSSWSAPVQVDSNSFAYDMLLSVSCASSSFCVAVDDGGDAFTFNGSSWSAPVRVDTIGNALLHSVSCASSSFCVAVDGGMNVLTFNGSSWTAPLKIESYVSGFPSVSCPSSSFCVAVDGFGNAFTYGTVRASSPQSSYGSDAPASDASAEVTVPAVSCAAIHAGSYSGQQAAVALLAGAPAATATVYPAESVELLTYCSGSTPVYAPEFVVYDVSNGTLVFHPASLAVSPGDQVSLNVSATPAGATLEISDLDTAHSASLPGPGFSASEGSDVLEGAITSNGHGAPMISGSLPAGSQSPVIAGPVPSSPVVFEDAEVDNKPLSSASGVVPVAWTNASGHTVASVSAIMAGGDFTVSFSTPPPVLAVSADVAPVSGTVLVKLPGTKRFVLLRNVINIPIGSTISALKGSLQVTSATPSGGPQSAVFYSGEFALLQSGSGKTPAMLKGPRVRGRRADPSVAGRSGQTTAVLTGGSFAGCPKPPHARATVAAKHKSKKVRQLWANAHGNFSTQGQYGSATVNGTEWLTQDQCGGTYFLVTRHAIVVTSFTLHNRKTRLTQGQHYLAPAPGY